MGSKVPLAEGRQGKRLLGTYEVLGTGVRRLRGTGAVGGAQSVRTGDGNCRVTVESVVICSASEPGALEEP